VGSAWEKRAAAKAVRRFRGVPAVEERLEVRLLDGDRRADAALRGDVLQALVPADRHRALV
jgi:hypothetical protein